MATIAGLAIMHRLNRSVNRQELAE